MPKISDTSNEARLWRQSLIDGAVKWLEETDRAVVLRTLAHAEGVSEEFQTNPEKLIELLRSAEQGSLLIVHGTTARDVLRSIAFMHDDNIDFSDERFVDKQYLEAHRQRELPIDSPHGGHRGVVVATSGQVAWIDEGVAELVYFMWANGVRTESSCENLYYQIPRAAKKAFLGFVDPSDLELFLSLAVPEDNRPGSVWDRATGCNLAKDTPESEIWEYDLIPQIDGRRAHLSVYVEFPIGDIPELVERLKALIPEKESDV